MQVAGDIHVIDGDQTGFADSKFAANDFADLALQAIRAPVGVEGRHILNWLRESSHSADRMNVHLEVLDARYSFCATFSTV